MKNGTVWRDDAENPIQAHGGCIVQHAGVWYWYGENKGAENLPGKSQVPFLGISCYSSPNLCDWHFEGNVLCAVELEGSTHPLHPSKVCERPKVIYHSGHQKFVMWMHLDEEDYSFARAGVAISESPTGPFHLLAARHVNRTDCRDMTLYQDREGVAYLVHSGDWNKTLYIAELNDEYTDVTGRYTKIMIDQEREAPAAFFHNGSYYMITSGCTGWNPNSALYSTSTRFFNGPEWKLIDNPCSGQGYRQTFGGQSAYVFEAKGQLYLLLDHWKRDNLQSSGYSILPILFSGDMMDIPWTEHFHGIV